MIVEISSKLKNGETETKYINTDKIVKKDVCKVPHDPASWSLHIWFGPEDFEYFVGTKEEVNGCAVGIAEGFFEPIEKACRSFAFGFREAK